MSMVMVLTNRDGENEILGTAALMALTTAAYWWGYRDVDKRHSQSSGGCFLLDDGCLER